MVTEPRFVSQEEFDEFVLTVLENVATKEDVSSVSQEVAKVSRELGELSARVDKLEQTMMRSFDSVWERFHQVDLVLGQILARLPDPGQT